MAIAHSVTVLDRRQFSYKLFFVLEHGTGLQPIPHPAPHFGAFSRPTGLGAVALAERICAEADRLDPTGMS